MALRSALRLIRPEPNRDIFPRSPLMAGFECSTHRRRDRVRLDLLRGTSHDANAARDYRLALRHGLATVRDGLRWHLIEPSPGRHDWSSWRPMLAAAQAAGVQVAWDIWHYGTPDHIDIFSDGFVEGLARLAEGAARLHREMSDETPIWCPLNEISFYSFIAGEVGDFHPYGLGRGYELKRQLARAAIAASEALRSVDPRCRLLWAEPLINVAPTTFAPEDIVEAENFRMSQYQTYDMISGRMEPNLGGRPDLLDVLGANYYPNNQWVLGGSAIAFGNHAYRPLSSMLVELHERYGRPIIIAETGAEGSARAPWLHYICHEVEAARAAGVPVGGVCIYPIVTYPGWDDDRHCETGLFGPVDADGSRFVYAPLLDEIARQRRRLDVLPAERA